MSSSRQTGAAGARIMGALLFLGPLVGGAAPAGVAEADDHATPSQSIDHPLIRPPELPMSRPGTVAVAKHKSYPTGEPVAERPGPDPPAATLFNVHTREAVTFFPGTMPDEQLLARFFRCRGFGEPGRLAPGLVEAMIAAAEGLGATRVEVLSAYRSPKFNDTLAKKGRRVAAESRHVKGEAVDLRLAGIPARRLGAWFWENFDGGVGTYPRSDFVHIDVGPRRRWLTR